LGIFEKIACFLSKSSGYPGSESNLEGFRRLLTKPGSGIPLCSFVRRSQVPLLRTYLWTDRKGRCYIWPNSWL